MKRFEQMFATFQDVSDLMALDTETKSDPQSAVRLNQCLPGRYRCDDIHASGNTALRLKRLGICEGLMLELIRSGDPLIVEVLGTRVGISRQVAAEISVAPILLTQSAGQLES